MSELHFVPPQSLESEMSILGAMILDNRAICTASGIISTQDFYRESHRQIFDAICRLDSAHEPCDMVTLTSELHKAGQLENAGGGAYLYQLIDYVPTAANIAFYCKNVKEKALERKVLLCGQDIITMVQQGKPAPEIIDTITNDLMNMTTAKNDAPTPAKTLIKNAIKALERRYENKGKLVGIPYGWDELDRATNGLQRQDLVIIAGRPSMGKSVALLNICESVCMSGYSSLLFSLEMSKERLIERSIASVGSVNFGRIRSGDFHSSDWSKLTGAAGQIDGYKLAIDDKPAITLAEIRAKARARKNREGLDLIGIDYLQLMGTSNNPSRTQAIGEITRGLKCLAKELDLTVVLLSQLNRGLENRQDKRPTMSDLRDSGEIEQDADVIIFPYREAAYCEKCRKKEDTPDHNLQWHQSQAEFIVAKQRDGEANLSIEVAFQGRYQRFKDVQDANCPF